MASRFHLAVLAAGLLAAAWLAIPTVETHPRISTTLLWNRDIAPILQRRCYQCHTEQNIAMSLATYRDGRPWAAAIREEALTRNMPPWSAVAGFGRFANDASLTQREIDLLVAWADGGAPSGQTLAEEAEPAVFVPSMPAWEHGDPDVVLKPAQGLDVAAGAAPFVARVDIPTGFTTPERVRGLAFKPGDRRVVRYASVYEKATGRWLFTWTPWQTDVQLPAGTAFVLPAHTVLTAEIAYRGADDAVSDRSEVGLYRADADAQPASVHTIGPAKAQTLAPGAGPVRIRTEQALSDTTTIVALWPDVGPEGRSVELTAVLPDGRVEPMLWLRQYRTDFRSPYLMDDSVTLPKGTRLVLTVYAVNDTDQPIAVDPRVFVVRVPATSMTM